MAPPVTNMHLARMVETRMSRPTMKTTGATLAMSSLRKLLTGEVSEGAVVPLSVRLLRAAMTPPIVVSSQPPQTISAECVLFAM